MFTKIIHTKASAHTFFVHSIDPAEVPAFAEKDAYDTFYAVRNFDKDGHIFMYLGKGDKNAPKEIVAWYRNTGAFWSSYGENIKDAIEGAQKDGWLYA